MRMYSSSWTPIAALSMLMSIACTGLEAPPASSGVVSVRHAETGFAVIVDGKENAYQKLQAQLKGQPISMEEVAKLLGDDTVEAKDLFQELDAGEQSAVEGARSTLSAKTLSFEGLDKLLESASRDVYVCGTFSLGGAPLQLCALLRAPGSQKKQDPEAQQALALAEQMGGLIQELSKRYPNPEKINPDEFMQKEAEQLEKIATLYCQASGQPVPCDPTKGHGGEPGDQKHPFSSWWNWLQQFVLPKVGVIPSGTSCPSNYEYVEIFHDDEDSSNANNHWGWLGGISQDNNTRYRFCKVPGYSFLPLANQGAQYNYAVLRLSFFCPAGTTHQTVRFFDNEDWNNRNTISSNAFPNMNTWGGNQVMFFCALESDASPPRMSGFPDMGFSYGVFAPTSMPWPYSLQAGYLYQDDEDNWNWDHWVDGPSNMMGGDDNTWMNLARVK